MKRTLNNKVNGNVFKSVVRGVVKEELVKSEKRMTKNLMDKIDEKFETTSRDLTEKIDEKFDENFTKYRDETVNKLDGVIGELKKGYEELTVHSGQHEEINNRLDGLDNIHPGGKHI